MQSRRAHQSIETLPGMLPAEIQVQTSWWSALLYRTRCRRGGVEGEREKRKRVEGKREKKEKGKEKEEIQHPASTSTSNKRPRNYANLFCTFPFCISNQATLILYSFFFCLNIYFIYTLKRGYHNCRPLNVILTIEAVIGFIYNQSIQYTFFMNRWITQSNSLSFSLSFSLSIS